MESHNSAHATEIDEVLTALSNQYSRQTLAHCRATSKNVSTISDLISALETHDLGDIELGIKLHHVVLPTLVNVGIVEYDSRSGTIRCHEHPTLQPMIDSILEAERRAVEDPRDV